MHGATSAARSSTLMGPLGAIELFTRWHMRLIKSAVNEGCKSKQILSIAFVHRPVNARLVGRRVAKHAEHALHEISEAALLTLFALSAQRVDREQWWIAA